MEREASNSFGKEYQYSMHEDVSFINRIQATTADYSKLRTILKHVNEVEFNGLVAWNEDLMGDIAVAVQLTDEDDITSLLEKSIDSLFRYQHLTNMTFIPLMECIHRLNLSAFTTVAFGLSDTGTLTKWRTPSIETKKEGMYDASYIPMITSLLLHEAVSTPDEWTVSFYLGKDLSLDNVSPFTKFKEDLSDYYKHIEAHVTRIVLVLPLDMGRKYRDEYGSLHVSTVVIMRGPNPYIALLDNLWFSRSHGDSHTDYINLMLIIAEATIATHTDTIQLAVPESCQKWIVTNTRKRRSKEKYQFINPEEFGHRWLKSALSSPISFDMKMPALICPFTAAVNTISCVRQQSLSDNRQGVDAIAARVYGYVDMMNEEVMKRVLSGGCIMTPVSIQSALAAIDYSKGSEQFFTVSRNTIPSVRMWSIDIVSESSTQVVIDTLYQDEPETDGRLMWKKSNPISFTSLKEFLVRLKTDPTLIESAASDMRAHMQLLIKKLNIILKDT